MKALLDGSTDIMFGLPNVQEQLEEKRIYGTTQFVILKKLNRLAHIRCKKGRDETNEVR